MPDRITHDGVLVIGAGLAGLSAALAAAPRKALVLSPEPLTHAAASAWAQGGVAAALSGDDSPAFHAADTIAAGAGLVDPDMARVLTEAAPEAVKALAALGAPFDRTSDGGFVQSREAAHSHARVARVGGDGAGRAIMEALAASVLAAPHVEVRTGWRLRGLLRDMSGRIRGAAVESGGRITQIEASSVILATGGIGGLYAVTTNPALLRGEGLGLAALAGARIADPEFVQFHPTAVDIGRDPAPLATEALRGEGARLIDKSGEPLMQGVHPQGDLAPRDVVARAIHAALLAGRRPMLDCRAAVGKEFPERFPVVFAACMAAGIDPRVTPIPVAPAAHYHMGGIHTDQDGASSVEGLWAAGECAATGVHGANRLASNSLLEAAVFGARAGRAAALAQAPTGSVLAESPPPQITAEALDILRPAMSRCAGVVREAESLTGLIETIDALATPAPAPALVAARLVAVAALARHESRGAHYREDYPQTDAKARSSEITLSAAAGDGLEMQVQWT